MKKSGKKIEPHRILYIIFMSIAALELIGAVLSIVFAADSNVRDAGYSNLFLAILAMLLFSAPGIIEARYKIDIPNYLEVVLLIFLFAALVLGNIHNFLVTVQGYDKILHTVSGFIIAIIGYEIIHMWSINKKEILSLSPGILSLFAFTFSITLLVLWEFYEFAVDTIAYNINSETVRNMQRYQWINDSIVFPQSYGLMDTMLDLIVGAFGAAIVSLIGWRILLKQNKKTILKDVKQ